MDYIKAIAKYYGCFSFYGTYGEFSFDRTTGKGINQKFRIKISGKLNKKV